ncbi:hypothetical protein JNUCC0626_48510 [Lentzea sp. JNUCC 0626]|uniref:hypothetical protein n=1 Tax=Lentzea sp. JNUCC 0626 TaxID=3367513 RepID=UPI00374818E7
MKAEREAVADMMEREGLPPDAVMIVADRVVPPLLRTPDDAWGLLIVAADFVPGTDELTLFAGQPLPDKPHASRHDGSVVVRLLPRPAGDDGISAVDVELLHARSGEWRTVGTWPTLGEDWPQRIAPTVADLMQAGADVVAASGRLLTGEHHAEAAGLTVGEIAGRLDQNIENLQHDGLFPNDAEFSVVADITHEVPVLRITFTSKPDVSDAIKGMSAHFAVQMLAELASHYNEVDLDRPGRSRFMQHIRVVCGNEEATFVGSMVQFRRVP